MSSPIEDENSIYWEYDLTNQVTGEYARSLIFREQQYFVRSLTGQPAQTIYIAL